MHNPRQQRKVNYDSFNTVSQEILLLSTMTQEATIGRGSTSSPSSDATTTTTTAQHHHPIKELHIAPMLNYSTREFRQLFRILSSQLILWTEMVVDDTIANATNLDAHLGYDVNTNACSTTSSNKTRRLVCQIGGSAPELCGPAAAVVCLQYQYHEINLNVDCPSDRVTSGQREFGASLMKQATRTANVLQSMQQHVGTEKHVSIKCRIGVDEWDSLEFMVKFIQTLQPVCRRFYLHARKCILGGRMNARQNRSVPPLNYPRIYELCRLFPDCDFWINGGIHTLKHAKQIVYGTIHNNTDTHCNNGNHAERKPLQHSVPCSLCAAPYGSCIAPPSRVPHNLRGCMMGRAAMEDPCLFADVDRYFYGLPRNPCQNRRQVLERYCVYLEKLYPRRCCDTDPRNTFEYPAPDVTIPDHQYCPICIDMYALNSHGIVNTIALIDVAKLSFGDNDAKPSPEDDGHGNGNILKKNNQNQSKPKPKISSRIIGRSLKPVQGMFHNVPKYSKLFRRVCDALGQDTSIRNCGPGYILRKAMQSIPDEILDREFVLN